MTDIWGRRIFKTGGVAVVLLGFKFKRLAMLLLFASAAIAQSQTPAADVPAFTAQGAFVAINCVRSLLFRDNDGNLIQFFTRHQ
jgi:hypothetical protein